MCLAIPMKILEIDGSRADVDIGGTKREISVQLLKDVNVGDYVIVHAGFAIEKLDEKVARETLELFAELEKLA